MLYWRERFFAYLVYKIPNYHIPLVWIIAFVREKMSHGDEFNTSPYFRPKYSHDRTINVLPKPYSPTDTPYGNKISFSDFTLERANSQKMYKSTKMAKMIILGDCGVGKTALINRWVIIGFIILHANQRYIDLNFCSTLIMILVVICASWRAWLVNVHFSHELSSLVLVISHSAGISGGSGCSRFVFGGLMDPDSRIVGGRQVNHGRGDISSLNVVCSKMEYAFTNSFFLSWVLIKRWRIEEWRGTNWSLFNHFEILL